MKGTKPVGDEELEQEREREIEAELGRNVLDK